MERINRSLKGHYRRKVITYFLTCCVFLNTSLPVALADVALDGIIRGDITVSPDPVIPDRTNMTASDGAIGHFSDFDIASGHFVNCVQPSTDASALFRVFSGDGTQILGQFDATGHIYLVDPAGILFEAGSEINVNRLVASGLNMSNDAFDAVLAGGEMEFAGGNGNVTNRTHIIADSVYLIGKKVFNNGVIEAPNRLVVIAAGDEVRLAQDGSNVSVVVSGLGDGDPDIRNSSIVSVDNGKIVLAAGDTFSRAISNVGYLAASGGEVEMQAAKVENNGVIIASSSGDGGSVKLTGTEEVTIGIDGLGVAGYIEADAGVTGNGGSVTIQTDGLFQIGEDSSITATGGSVSGNGGSVTITCDDFKVNGEINASPGNTDYEPGSLEVVTADVTIAAGENLGELDTIYEDDIEILSQGGTSLIVTAEDSIIVQNIPDDGIIEGRYGNIELHATGADSTVLFEDKADTISTTLGDIVMEAGSGGINIGSLETAKDSSDIRPTPGQITLTTNNRGHITTENLTIKDGWGHAEINVDASGDLTVNGDVVVGRDSAINNIPLGADAEAMIYLNAGDSMILNGDVRADADGIHEGIEGGVTKAYIGISAGFNEVGNGDATINGDLVALARSTSQGTSEATIEIDVWGFINWGLEAALPLADGDEGQVHVESRTTASEENAGNVAQIIVSGQGNAPAPEAMPDFPETHMGDLVSGNVLENDFDPEGEPLTAELVDGPSHAESFTLNEDGSYSYTPEPGYVGTDSFTYTASAGGGTTAPILVTITMTNTPPVADGDASTTHMGAIFNGTIQDHVSDPDGDPLVTAIITDTEHGKLTLNPDGTYTYEPDEGYVGTDSFTFSATDGEIDAEPVQLTGTIIVTNTQPALNNDTVRTNRGTAVVIDVLTNDSDPDGDPLTVDSFTYEGAGTVVLNEDNTITYTPATGFYGEDSFTYTVSDGQLGAESVETTVTIAVSLGYIPPAPLNMPTEQGLERTEIKISGCPALMTWVADELGIDKRMMEIWVVNSLATTGNIQPCEACTNLKQAAKILLDTDGTHIAALTQVINEYAHSNAPLSVEQMASIAQAMARNNKSENQYSIAEEYLSALAEYVSILSMDLGFSPEESVQFATEKYISRLTKNGNVGIAAYITARLDSLAMFLSMSLLEPVYPSPYTDW